MTLKQRVLEGILVGVVGGLVATAIGGMGVILYNEMADSRKQLKETTKVTKQLNNSSIDGISRANILEKSISSLKSRIENLEKENEVLSIVNIENRKAIGLLTKTLKQASFTKRPDFTNKIKKIEDTALTSKEQLKTLPKIISDRGEIQVKQQQQQIQLDTYRFKQLQQQQVQQQQQQEWQ